MRKTLSQDQFKKQLAKHLDKIERGEDFEFKNGHKKAAIAAASAAAAEIFFFRVASLCALFQASVFFPFLAVLRFKIRSITV